jgi:hypothetical protein
MSKTAYPFTASLRNMAWLRAAVYCFTAAADRMPPPRVADRPGRPELSRVAADPGRSVIYTA